ncbi:MAG: DUF58 domain-containing protein [Verrucomicrobiota bacterium]|jgi:uncharacterized protein (DUF58 family)
MAVPPVIPRAPPPLSRAPRAPPRMPPVRPVRRLPPLDMKLLADLPSLELQARYLVDGFLNGRHRSPQRGASVEFAEYRNYQFGDEPRRVDWRLFGRTDRLHVKQYEAETQLRIFLVLDTSASMDFKSRPEAMNKIEYARLTVAGLAALARRQGDAFGLGLAGLDLKEFLRAHCSVPHWKSFIGRLEAVQPAGSTALARVLESLAELIPARSMVFVASDFYEDPVRLRAALQRLRYDHHEVIGLQVLDPLEMDFDRDQGGVFVDAESGQRLRLDAPAAREGYLQRFRAFCSDLDEIFRAAGGDVTRLRTNESPVLALTRYLAERAQRLK